MSNQIIYNKWTEFINDGKYKIYCQSNEESWNESFNEVIKYIIENNKLPSKSNNDIQIKKLGLWIGTQLKSYKNKEQIMSNQIIYNKWTEFINDDKYKIYFQSNEKLWFESFNKVIEYIDKNEKRPFDKDKDNEIKKLGSWISHQITNFKKKEQIMKNEIIYNKWNEFINNKKYKIYFQSNEELWYESFNKVKEYIIENKKRPLDKDNKIKKLGKWIYLQMSNHKKKEQIMKNEIIYNKWSEFINDEKYKQYFKK
jgi:hypothetical protein